jgi:hypothetical protein
MEGILRFLQNYFNFNVLILFLISSLFLILVDCKEYKKNGLKKEYKFSLYTGIIYIAVGFAVYGFSRFIRV